MSDWEDALAEAGLKQDLSAPVGEDVRRRSPGRPKGWVMPEAVRKKIGDAQRGRKRSYEQRQNIKDGLRRYWRDPELGWKRRAQHAALMGDVFLNKRRNSDYRETRQSLLDYRAHQAEQEIADKLRVEDDRALRIIDARPEPVERRPLSKAPRPLLGVPTFDELIETAAATLNIDPIMLRALVKETGEAQVEREEKAASTFAQRLLKRMSDPGHAATNAERKQLKLELEAGHLTEGEAAEAVRILGL